MLRMMRWIRREATQKKSGTEWPLTIQSRNLYLYRSILAMPRNLLGDADRAAGESSAGVSGRLSLEVIDTGVHDDAAAND